MAIMPPLFTVYPEELGEPGLRSAIGEKPIVAADVKKLLAVEGDIVAIQPAENLFCLALFRRKPPQRAIGGPSSEEARPTGSPSARKSTPVFPTDRPT